MKLSLQTFTNLVQGMAAAAQAASQQVLDISVGSTLRAVLEANASVGLWMQWLILQVLQMTRAATSTGADLDSWMADFRLVRLPATPATGTVTFSRLVPAMPALVPVGALVRTSNAAVTFIVTCDPANQSWDPVQEGYCLPSGAASADVPVQAEQPGTAGNVQAGTVSKLASALPGIDAVINASPFANGMDPEPDQAFRSRFQTYLDSRSRATRSAVAYAITSVQQGLSYTILENEDPTGATRMGQFIVTVDDGTGSPSPALISAIYAAIDQIRPLGSTFFLRGPDILPAAVSMAVSLAPAADRNAVVGKIVNAVSAYVNALGVGGNLPITRIAQVAYDADPRVVSVGQVLMNGATSDLAATSSQLIRATQITVN